MIPDWEPMRLVIGNPMYPPIVEKIAKLEDVRDWHSKIMEKISQLSGKEWSGNSMRKL